MQPETTDSDSKRRSSFVESLSAFSRQHRAQHWEGTFSDFLSNILPNRPSAFARSSHQYIWDMLRWYGRASDTKDDTLKARELFKRELFGIDEPLARVGDYFKAAAAGSDVGRRLLLLLGPPSGGKSTLAILLKRGLEEYSRTDEGALYGIKGSPMHESPLNLIPASLRAQFRDTYGVELGGELSPWARERLEREYDGDYLRVPVERVFLSEATRMGIGTYAPHDPTTADIADLVGSVDLSKVAEVGDEGDPRAWSWSGAVYAVSRGMLEMIDPLLLLLGVHARIAFDGIFECKQKLHAGEALGVTACNSVRNGIDHETRTHTGQPLIGRFGTQARRFRFGESFDAFARVDAQLLR